MKKSTQIILTIAGIILFNILIIIGWIARNAFTIPECEAIINEASYTYKDSLFFTTWLIAQLIVLIILLFRFKYKTPIIVAISIWALISMALFTSIKKGFFFSYYEYDRTDWVGGFKEPYAQGIIERGDLKNKCEPELIEMLGEPQARSENTLIYDLIFGKFVVELDGGCHKSARIECTY